MLPMIRWAACVCMSAALAASAAATDPYDAPAGYYAGATGTGTTLKSQLKSIMSNGHILRSYGDFRYMAAITDADPNHAGNILLVYNRASVAGAWDSGDTWDREHLWPQSLQPGTASNDTTGSLADPFMLRPCNPSINSSRSNSPYGLDYTTGSYGAVSGGYYYPGDADAGDVARSMFYAATRWESNGLTLVEGLPSGYQMGDLSSLLHWHYLDTPDEFERHRNQAIYSAALNPTYYTNNRNAYIDRPEYAWSVFADQMNDTRLYLGSSAAADGSSTVNLNMGSIIRGAAAPGAVAVTLNKAGLDGTYYQVTASGDATSDVTGRYNAFAMDSTGSRTLHLGLNVNTNVAGNYSGQVVVDNLDVTTQGGTGRGANDGNDVANLSLTVLEHSNASFSGSSDLNNLEIDFGNVPLGAATEQTFSIFNLAGNPALTAGLDLDQIFTNGDTGILNLQEDYFTNLTAGTGSLLTATFDPLQVGSFATDILLSLSDQNLPGETTGQLLTLHLLGRVLQPGDADGDDKVNLSDLQILGDHWMQSGVSLAEGDFNGDHEVNLSDLQILGDNWGAGTGSDLAFDEALATLSLAAPEPTSILAWLAATSTLMLPRKAARSV